MGHCLKPIKLDKYGPPNRLGHIHRWLPIPLSFIWRISNSNIACTFSIEKVRGSLTPKKKKSARSGNYSFEVRDLWYTLELLAYRSEKWIITESCEASHSSILFCILYLETVLTYSKWLIHGGIRSTYVWCALPHLLSLIDWLGDMDKFFDQIGLSNIKKVWFVNMKQIRWKGLLVRYWKLSP